jgi:hypothetical protein
MRIVSGRLGVHGVTALRASPAAGPADRMITGLKPQIL